MRSSQWIKAPRNKRYQRKSAKCAGNIIARITQITQILNYDPRSLVRDCFVGRPDWHRYVRLARTARGRSRERLSKTLWLLQPQPMSALQFPTYNAVIVSGTKWSEAIPWFKKHVTPTDYVAGSLVRDCFVGRPDCRRYVRLATICVEYLRTDYTDFKKSKIMVHAVVKKESGTDVSTTVIKVYNPETIDYFCHLSTEKCQTSYSFYRIT